MSNEPSIHAGDCRRGAATPRIVLVLVTLTCAPAGRAAAGAAAQTPQSPGRHMQDAARALLDAATDHLADLQTGAENPERRRWSYETEPRRGLPLLAVDDETTRQRIRDLVDSGLGDRGRQLVSQILALQEVRYARSGNDDRLDPGRYFITLFGTPGPLGRWGWRFEGNHVSLSFRVRDGRVVGTTPMFFGADTTGLDPLDVDVELRPFAPEDEGARALLTGLEESARRTALVAASAPDDILTGNDVPAARPPLMGIACAEIDPDSRARLLDLLRLYASRLAPELAEREMQAIEDAGLDSVRFAWAGHEEPGQPHYYRIQGPGFLIEYSATGEDARHVHSVWRDFERDFGNEPRGGAS